MEIVMYHASGGRRHPRMSLAKMGEYLDASAHRRETILREQKFPSVFMQNRYEHARRAIQAALQSSDVRAELGRRLLRVEGLPSRTKHEMESIRSSTEAIRKFGSLYDSLGIEGLSASIPATSMALTVEGVRVSVAPTAYLHKLSRRRGVESGALMVVMAKTHPLQDHGGKAVAEILRQAVAATGQVGLRPELCVAVDLFSGRVYRASGRGQRVGAELASACREIATRWPTLEGKAA